MESVWEERLLDNLAQPSRLPSVFSQGISFPSNHLPISVAVSYMIGPITMYFQYSSSHLLKSIISSAADSVKGEMLSKETDLSKQINQV